MLRSRQWYTFALNIYHRKTFRKAVFSNQMWKDAKKRADRSFSSSPTSGDKKARLTSEEMSDVNNFSQLVDMIKTLQESLESKLHEIRVEMDCFRHEIKESLNVFFFLETVAKIESSLEEAWARIDEFKEELKAQKQIKETQQLEIDDLKEEVIKLNAQLAKEKENNVALESYNRRENLKFNNIPENKDDNCKELVTEIIDCELGISPMYRPQAEEIIRSSQDFYAGKAMN